MTSSSLRPTAYDDLATPAEMHADCCAASVNLHVELHNDLRFEEVARRAARPAPSIRFDDQPAERPKPTIDFSEAAARLAGALHFHLD